MKHYSKTLLSVIAANLLLIGLSGCSGGSSSNSSDDDLGGGEATSFTTVQVYQGSLTECRVADDKGHIATEENPNIYKFVYPSSETLGDIEAESCKESTSGLRYDFTMKAGQSNIISAYTTLQKEYPSVLDKIASITPFEKSDLLGDFSKDNTNQDMLRIANIIALMYHTDSMKEFKNQIQSALTLQDIFTQAKESLHDKYNGKDISSYETLINKIELTDASNLSNFYSIIKRSAALAKVIEKVPTENVDTLGKIGFTVIDPEGNAIPDVNVKVDANIVDAESKPLQNEFLTTEEGTAFFYVKANSNGDNLILVTLKKDGYLDSGFQLDPTDLNATLSEVIQLIPLQAEALPSGVALDHKEIPSNNINNDGSVNTDIVLSVDNNVSNENNATVNTNLEVKIPAGVKLLDENNQSVTGSLTSTVVSFGTGEENEDALNSFPGGFQVRVNGVPDENNTQLADTNVTFQSAGFASIQIKDENGTKVKNFSGEGIEIAMEVKKGIFNPATGKEIAVGDEVPIWHYNEDTGEWGYEELGVVKDINKKDVWGVVFKATHLTYFNLDWHNGDVCKTRVNIIDEDTGERIKNISTQIKVITPSSICGSNNVVDDRKDGYFDIENVPRNEIVKFEIRYKNKLIGSKRTRLSNQGTYWYEKWGGARSYRNCSVDIIVRDPEPVKKTITAYEQCSDGSKKSYVSNSFIYTRNNYYRYIGQTNANGKMIVDGDNANMIQGYASKFSRKYKSYYSFFQIPADKSEKDVIFTLRDKYCATPSSQIITIAKQQIQFDNSDGTADVNVTTIEKQKDEVWNRNLYRLSRVAYDTIEENINLEKMKNNRNAVVAINIRKVDKQTGEEKFNINSVFTSIDINQNYRLMQYGDKYYIFATVKDKPDVFVNAAIDERNELSSFVKNDYTGTWYLNPYYLFLNDIIEKEEFKDSVDKLKENISKEGDFEITLMFSDDIELKDFYGKGKASEIMGTKYKRIVEPMCQGKSDCTIKYFKTTIDLKNAN